jgi:hypothetical protein
MPRDRECSIAWEARRCSPQLCLQTLATLPSPSPASRCMPLQASLSCHLCSNRNLTPVAIPQGLPVDAALQRGLKVGMQPRIKPVHDSKLTRCLQDACLAFMGQEAASGLQVPPPPPPHPPPPPGNAATNSRCLTSVVAAGACRQQHLLRGARVHQGSGSGLDLACVVLIA